jgi:pteridine reductase
VKSPTDAWSAAVLASSDLLGERQNRDGAGESNMDLKNRIVLITGAARRVGRVLALELAARGARLALHYHRSKAEAEELKRQLENTGGVAEIFAADLAAFAETNSLIERVHGHFGELDVLINNAAIFECTPLDELTEADWDRHLNINLKAPFFLCRNAARFMRQSTIPERRGGRIINIADAEIAHPWPAYLPYSISKAALVTMTRGLARTLAPDIQVNALGPGTVLPPLDDEAQDIEQAIRRIPLKRLGSPTDIAQAVCFLLENGDYLTGAFIPIDGGSSIV